MEVQGAFGLKQVKVDELSVSLKRDAPIKKTYNLTLGEPRLSEFPYELLDELKNIEQINNYYPSLGDMVLRQNIIDKYYENLNTDNIIITHGAIGALDVIMRSTLNADSEILLPNPGFPPYEKLAELSGAKIVKYNINLYSQSSLIDWDHILKNISDKTKIILLNSPHNPSGKLFTLKDRDFLKQILIHYPHLMFVMDEVYRDLIYSGLNHYDLSEFIERGYIINSFSKIYPLQGARVGWVVANAENIKKMSVIYNNAYGAISSFGQELAKLLLAKNVNYQPRYREARESACKILDSYGVDYIFPHGAFFICVNYSCSDLDVISDLREEGIHAVPGSAFGTLSTGFIRLSFAQGPDVLREAFHIIGKHWQTNKKERLTC
jgi:aspartate/methionine/tyrosine aminotransferase